MMLFLADARVKENRKALLCKKSGDRLCGTRGGHVQRIGHTMRRWRFLHPKRGRIEVVRGATTSSCFRFGIPTGHSSGSHSTARAISFYPALPSSSWEWKAHFNGPRPVRLYGAGQGKYARLQHRLERK